MEKITVYKGFTIFKTIRGTYVVRPNVFNRRKVFSTVDAAKRAVNRYEKAQLSRDKSWLKRVKL